jgi:muramidase (phage lysozyme)
VTNLQAFLDMIAYSEIGPQLLALSDNGYNVLVGSTPSHPVLFDSYADHPRQLVDLGNGLKSSAAGRYQLLKKMFDAYRSMLNLPDFSPASQDAIAVQMIRERGALEEIYLGDFERAVARVRGIWASLPGAGYGQHENAIADLRTAYVQAGGTLSPARA